ncbi:MAG: sigma-E processing peptidase SpoIIGA [Lachnospiraceae bacterium]|nr:sigma-E processing peptidase SpoIIGA [Lachnospiraceae bacterium]
MNYTVYADVMIFWNFIINILSLTISSRILRISINHKKILFWSFITSIITTIIYILFHNSIFLHLFYAFAYIIMTYVYFKSASIKDLLLENLAVIISMFLIYGIINTFSGGEHPLLKRLISTISIGMLMFFTVVKYSLHKLSGRYYHLTLELSGRKVKATGYADTGNILQDIYTHKPVIILDYRLMKSLVSEDAYKYIYKYHETGYLDYMAISEELDTPIYPVPYSTIDSSSSLMPVFKLNSLEFNDDEEILEQVSAGISRHRLKNDFQILLNEKLKS